MFLADFALRKISNLQACFCKRLVRKWSRASADGQPTGTSPLARNLLK